MDQVRQIEFVNRFFQNPVEQDEEKKFSVTTDPELVGTWSKKPLLFGLHPQYAQGKHYMVTLDYKPVQKGQAAGANSDEQTRQIAEWLGVNDDGKNALDYHKKKAENVSV